jgi:hypothetical protein
VNDVERWIYFDGPVPASVRPLLDALDEGDTPPPTPQEKERVMADFFATLDARLARAGEARAEEGRDRREPEAPAAPPEEVRAIAPGDAPLGFEAWAELSIRWIGAHTEEKLAELGARGLTLEVWTRLDDAYLRALSADLIAGRTERPARYASLCNAEMARRAGTPAPEAPASMPPVVRAPESLRGTAEGLDLPAAVREAMARLPFREPAPASTAAPSSKAGNLKTMPVPVMRRDTGRTLPLDDDAIRKAVAAVPFAGSAGGGVVQVPSLTVQQYVSLRTELALQPEQWSETLRRYGVPNEASRRALDEHWQEQIARRPELKAEIEAAAATYTRWLQGPKK